MADLKALIKQGEGISVEFKECGRTLNRNVYETVCAFLNRHGGSLLLGVGNAGAVTGVDPDCEVASNILIHREYTNAFPAKLIIEYGQVRTENSNKPHGFGLLNPETFTPFPKNPVISRFFRQIGMADELGSGMRKMMRYCKTYGGADPEMIEGDVFRIVVNVPEFGKPAPKDMSLRPESGEVTRQAPDKYPTSPVAVSKNTVSPMPESSC